MYFNTRIEGIEEWISQNDFLEESQFNRIKLFDQKYLNFQIDDCYDFMDQITGKIRDDIFRVLFSTYLNWKQELIKLNIPFYLGAWIYDPRLPKSEIVCAVGIEKIEYYRKECFDLVKQRKSLINVKQFKGEGLALDWTQKIDYDRLEDWEINFPKEHYECEKDWEECQIRFRDFKICSSKTTNDEFGNTYHKAVGDIWTGELISYFQ